MNTKSIILSSGSYLPENIIYNDDLHQFPIIYRKSIEDKAGILSRRYVNQSQSTSDIAIVAANKCLNRINFNPENIDAIILSTSTPDRLQPATATRVQYEIGATSAFAFDINSVCSGSIYSLHIADSMIRSGFCKNILLIASEIYSKIINHSDISTCPYFGDGAGAILLGANSTSDRGIIKTILRTDGQRADFIQVPAGGTMMPFDQITNKKDLYFKMYGKGVYDFAVSEGSNIINDIINITGIDKNNIDLFITHQANINIINEIANRVEVSNTRFAINLDKYGNTASASILIAMDELIHEGKIKEDSMVLLVSFGGGLSWGASLIIF